jgi:hypothetical protein
VQQFFMFCQTTGVSSPAPPQSWSHVTSSLTP